jgi:cell volume regulation protein A
LISWVGLRGAVPIVFATYPLLAGAEKAQMIFNIVFFVSLTSVVIQGTTLPVVARLLHLVLPEKAKQRTPVDLELAESIKSVLTEISIPSESKVIGKPLVEIGIPKTSLISILQRGGKFITPSGATVIEPHDRLFVISEDKEALRKVLETLDIKTLSDDKLTKDQLISEDPLF